MPPTDDVEIDRNDPGDWNAIGERTLFHLSCCRDAERELSHQEHITGEGPAQIVGPPNSTWADLIAAMMEGFERGWIREAHFTRSGGLTHLRWTATERGDRALDAFKRRLAKAPVYDEETGNRLDDPLGNIGESGECGA